MDRLPRITSETVRSILQDTIKDKTHKMPTDAAIEKLARVMDRMKAQCFQYERDRPYTDHVRFILEQTNNVEKFIADHIVKRSENGDTRTLMIEDAEGHLDIQMTYAGIDLAALQTSITHFREALKQSISIFEMISPQEKHNKTPTSKQWHVFIFELADGFVEAVRSIDPAADVRLHAEGPTARFLAKAVHHTSGEVVTTQAIAGYVSNDMRKR